VEVVNNVKQTTENYQQLATEIINEIHQKFDISINAKDPIMIQHFLNEKLLRINSKLQYQFLQSIIEPIKNITQATQFLSKNDDLIKELKNELQQLLKANNSNKQEDEGTTNHFDVMNSLFERINKSNQQIKQTLQQNAIQVKAALIEANNLDNLESTPILQKLNTVSTHLNWTFKAIAAASVFNFLLMGFFWFWLFK